MIASQISIYLEYALSAALLLHPVVLDRGVTRRFSVSLSPLVMEPGITTMDKLRLAC